MGSNLVATIKKMSMDAVEASRPVGFLFGTILSVEPLKVQISQQKILEKAFFTLTNNVKDYNTTITIDGVARNCIINNGLKKDEKVIIMQFQGGQDYIILDRL